MPSPSSSAAPALALAVLPIERKVLFPRTYLRLTITAAPALQLLKDLVWDGQTAKAALPTASSHSSSGRRAGSAPAAGSLTLAVFTRRPVVTENQEPPSEQQQQPPSSELYDVGTVAKIVQLTRVQGSSGLTILVQGLARVRLGDVAQTTPYLVATVHPLLPPPPPSSSSPSSSEGDDDAATGTDMVARANKLKELTQEYMELTKRGAAVLRKTSGVINAIGSSSVGELADVVVSYMDIDVSAKQRVLEAVGIRARCDLATTLLQQEIEKANLQKKIASDVQDRLEGSRKEFLLRQQLEAIKKELGETDDDGNDAHDLKMLEDRLKTLSLDPKAEKVAARELRRLKNMPTSQPEYSILHNYLEFFTELPWNKQTEDTLVVRDVQRQLDADHYGLEKVKKRITEYIAVRSLKKDMKGPILCLLGPPGVGKTSLGKSIAVATKRKFERVALGGVHDESEIRGHRKTYIGAMPGCILNALRHAESKNPVILLDEIDKIGKDYRGDPSSALLEVLDPHQNNTFSDHYLNVPFDLSHVMFIATANSMDTIPGPLRDRMEVIDVSGYSVEQKLEIATRYLLPRQIEENGLREGSVQVPADALRFLIMGYTREAGVRSLERQLAAICRYVAVSVVNERDGSSSSSTRANKNQATVVDKDMIQRVLGHEMIFNEVALRSSVPGVATGMSWSTVGGSILFVEASCTRVASASQFIAASSSSSVSLPRLHLTGKLGDVMKESAQLALSWIRANTQFIELPPPATSKFLSLDGITDVHVHFPEGAIPKDGPSAGGAIVCALLSVIAGIPVPSDIAMTGEITLRGVILPVGGIREKVLAAIRAGIKRVILPKGNQFEADELQQEFARADKATTAAAPTTATTKRKQVKNGSSHGDAQLLFVSDVKELVHLVFGMRVHDEHNGDFGLDPFGSPKQSAGENEKGSPFQFSKL